MRISAAAKAETRERLLSSARRMFAERGYDRTTTRDIAIASGVATGTLFNYFESKEALGMVLLARAFEQAPVERSQAGSLEGALFSHAAATLRCMGAFRSWAARVLLGASADPARVAGAGSLRARVIEVSSELVAEYGRGSLSPVMLHLYWTLYSGVVAFWSGDTSENQSDSHGLLARSLRLFVRALDESAAA